MWFVKLFRPILCFSLILSLTHCSLFSGGDDHEKTTQENSSVSLEKIENPLYLVMTADLEGDGFQNLYLIESATASRPIVLNYPIPPNSAVEFHWVSPDKKGVVYQTKDQGLYYVSLNDPSQIGPPTPLHPSFKTGYSHFQFAPNLEAKKLFFMHDKTDQRSLWVANISENGNIGPAIPILDSEIEAQQYAFSYEISQDGQHLAYQTDQNSGLSLINLNSSNEASSPIELIPSFDPLTDSIANYQFSRDGQLILLLGQFQGGQSHLYLIDVSDPDVISEPMQLSTESIEGDYVHSFQQHPNLNQVLYTLRNQDLEDYYWIDLSDINNISEPINLKINDEMEKKFIHQYQWTGRGLETLFLAGPSLEGPWQLFFIDLNNLESLDSPTRLNPLLSEAESIEEFLISPNFTTLFYHVKNLKENFTTLYALDFAEPTQVKEPTNILLKLAETDTRIDPQSQWFADSLHYEGEGNALFLTVGFQESYLKSHQYYVLDILDSSLSDGMVFYPQRLDINFFPHVTFLK